MFQDFSFGTREEEGEGGTTFMSLVMLVFLRAGSTTMSLEADGIFRVLSFLPVQTVDWSTEALSDQHKFGALQQMTEVSLLDIVSFPFIEMLHTVH